VLHCPQTAISYFFVCVSLLFTVMYLHINIWCATGIYLVLMEAFLWHNQTLKEHENLKQFILVLLSQNITTVFSTE